MKRFVKKNATEKHYVNVGRGATIFLFLASIIVTSQLTSVEKAWEFLLAMGAGTGLVLILRWYWWRINAWSEISAMVVSFLASLVFMRIIPPRFAAGDPLDLPGRAARDGHADRGRHGHDRRQSPARGSDPELRR